jgi:hypothetical protein
MKNDEMARWLREHALELEKEGGNLYRSRAFRTAASQLLMMSKPVAEVFREEGRVGLERLPGIGKSLAYTLEGLLQTGELRTIRPLDALREPDRDLTNLPGVGIRTAEQLRDRLGITSLQGLRDAVAEGRLAEAGIPAGRLRLISEEVHRRLGVRRKPLAPKDEPAVADLLAVDEEYRRRGSKGELPKIAPREYHPEGETWLALLRKEVGGWKMRALHSNTAVAHRMGMTQDWVVIYFDREETIGQRTVVTESRGDLGGKRVVRGRENECRAHYQRQLDPVA